MQPPSVSGSQPAAASGGTLIAVAVAVPGLDLLTYRVPPALPVPVPGTRVLVPLGSRLVTGCVAPGEGDRADGSIRDVVEVLDSESFLPGPVLDLALWVSDYYACGPGEAVAAAMPPNASIESERAAEITGAGRDRLTAGLPMGARRAVLTALGPGRPVRLAALRRALGRDRGAASGLSALLTMMEREGLVRMLRPLQGRAAAFRTVLHATLTAAAGELLAGREERGAGRALTPRQREALEALHGAPEGLPVPALAARGITADVLTRLARRGLVSIARTRVDRDPFAQTGDMSGSEPVTAAGAAGPVALTPEQTEAVERLGALADRGTFHAALLHGVTGSGKTEVYLRLADRVRGGGRGVLVLVPEIALTPAVAAAFRHRFGDAVAVQHSGLADGERHDQWHRIRRGDVHLVVGTRSAVFAPIGSLGLIVVDEEQDAAYKQEESPRYHARDVAVMRAKQADALVVLGSATPSLETYHNALAGRYAHVVLERRVLDRPLAGVRIVDMREEYAARGPDVVIGAELAAALAGRLERREQAIVLLNRRGFATAVFCRQCGGTLECPNCSVSLTVHRAARRARCHYCNYAISIPRTCGDCAAPYLEQTGFGTERVEAELRALLPAARVARVDRDTIRRRGAAAGILGRFRRGEIDVLVGTQMIAKGHDFPRVTLVGVVSADVGLGLADFRAAERTFQLLTQVAGRAGRGDRRGEAIVQTIHPAHYSIRHACRQAYAAFYEAEIQYRRGLRYPPVVALINVIVRAGSAGDAMRDATDLVRRLRAAAPDVRVLGPAPAPLARLRGEHRAQFFLKGAHRAPLRAALLATLSAFPELRRRVTVDVDPMSVL